MSRYKVSFTTGERSVIVNSQREARRVARRAGASVCAMTDGNEQTWWCYSDRAAAAKDRMGAHPNLVVAAFTRLRRGDPGFEPGP